MKNFKIGDKVSWHWGRGKARGYIQEIYTSSVTKKIKDKNIKRNGSLENPIYFIKTLKNSFVLKFKKSLSDEAYIN